MRDTKLVLTYLLTLYTFLSVCQSYIHHHPLLTVVQVPGLCQMDAFSTFVFTDGIKGLAHTLSSSLKRRV